eukprot:m.168871 g.168871  ORF g.168871 m.168871 type:complete len:427 (+) comp31541_c0_seq1:157-1437(+)
MSIRKATGTGVLFCSNSSRSWQHNHHMNVRSFVQPRTNFSLHTASRYHRTWPHHRAFLPWWRTQTGAAKDVIGRFQGSFRNMTTEAVAAGVSPKLMSFCTRLRKVVGAESNPTRIPFFIHFGNLMAVFAMGSSDMLPLRSFMIGASTFGILYNLLQPIPLVAAAGWGIFFIIGHAVQISRILLDKQAVTLTSCQNELYTEAFLKFGYSPKQFLTLIESSNAKWITVPAGKEIFTQGDPITTIAYKLTGVHQMLRKDRVLGEGDHKHTHGKGDWLGEVWDADYDFSRVHHWMVTFRAKSEMRVVTFDIKLLHDAIKSNPALVTAADRQQINDLWGKLQNSNREFNKTIENKENEMTKLHQDSYEAMLKLAFADGVLTVDEINLIKLQQEVHGISSAQHEKMINRLGYAKIWNDVTTNLARFQTLEKK